MFNRGISKKKIGKIKLKNLIYSNLVYEETTIESEVKNLTEENKNNNYNNNINNNNKMKKKRKHNNNNLGCSTTSSQCSFRNSIVNSIYFEVFFKCLLFYTTTKLVYTVLDLFSIKSTDVKLFIYGTLTIIIAQTKPDTEDYVTNFEWLLYLMIVTKIINMIKKII